MDAYTTLIDALNETKQSEFFKMYQILSGKRVFYLEKTNQLVSVNSLIIYIGLSPLFLIAFLFTCIPWGRRSMTVSQSGVYKMLDTLALNWSIPNPNEKSSNVLSALTTLFGQLDKLLKQHNPSKSETLNVLLLFRIPKIDKLHFEHPLSEEPWYLVLRIGHSWGHKIRDLAVETIYPDSTPADITWCSDGKISTERRGGCSRWKTANSLQCKPQM